MFATTIVYNTIQSHNLTIIFFKLYVSGMLHGFKTIYKTEGIKGYFAGINAISTRIGIGSGVQLTTFSALV